MKIRFFVGLLLLTVLARAAEFAFAEATIDDLQARMAAGKLTSHELTAAYLARIAEIDRGGPKLNAVLELNPDAMIIADALDVICYLRKVITHHNHFPIAIEYIAQFLPLLFTLLNPVLQSPSNGR
jgi:hypothetical protein